MRMLAGRRSSWMAGTAGGSLLVLASFLFLLVACDWAGMPLRIDPTPTPGHEVHVAFVNRAVDVFPKVGDLLVVDPTGSGAVEFGNNAVDVLKQQGAQWRFRVLAVGVTTVTVRNVNGQAMTMYVRPQSP